MTLPVWPSAVPHEVQDGWQTSEMFLAADATEMNGGNQRLRAKPGNNVAKVTYPLQPLTVDEWQTLESFFRTTLGNGASRWTMPVLTGADYVFKTVQLDQGKSPSVQRKADLVYVTMQLRVYGV